MIHGLVFCDIFFASLACLTFPLSWPVGVTSQQGRVCCEWPSLKVLLWRRISASLRKTVNTCQYIWINCILQTKNIGWHQSDTFLKIQTFFGFFNAQSAVITRKLFWWLEGWWQDATIYGLICLDLTYSSEPFLQTAVVSHPLWWKVISRSHLWVRLRANSKRNCTLNRWKLSYPIKI